MTTEKVVGHSLWALSFMDPTDPAVEVTCLPHKRAEQNNFLPCFVFIVFTASFKISILSGFCFNLMFYSWDYKTRCLSKTGEEGGLIFLSLEKFAL